jgi:hypothetical protein
MAGYKAQEEGAALEDQETQDLLEEMVALH